MRVLYSATMLSLILRSIHLAGVSKDGHALPHA